MKLILYNNFSESNKVDKTISKIIELEGSLLEATSLVNPSVKVFFNPEDMNGYVVEDNQAYIVFNGLKITWDSFIYNYVLSANYAYIPLFNRYYVINDIISIRNNIWRLNMSVDVLMSYKKEIRNLYAFVTRNEFDYNKYIKDDLVNFKYDKEVKYYNVNNIGAVTEFKTTTANPNTVISYLTDDSVEYSGSTPALDDLTVIGSYTSGGNIQTQYLVQSGGGARDIIKNVYKKDTLKTYLKSVVSYPYDIEYFVPASPPSSIKIGDVSITLTETFMYPKYYPDRVVIADFIYELDDSSFLDYSPYSTHEIFIPYKGWVEISAELLLNYHIKVFYVVNYEDATATAYIYNVDLNKVIYSSNCSLGVKLAVSSTNATEIKNQKNALALNTAVQSVGAIASIYAGATSGNAYAASSGIISLAGTIGNAYSSYNQMYDKGNVEIASGSDGFSNSQEVLIKITKAKTVGYDNDYAKLFGKPLNEYRKLEGLSGYTTVGQVHLENIGSATNTEITELDTLLKTGIIL